MHKTRALQPNNITIKFCISPHSAATLSPILVTTHLFGNFPRRTYCAVILRRMRPKYFQSKCRWMMKFIAFCLVQNNYTRTDVVTTKVGQTNFEDVPHLKFSSVQSSARLIQREIWKLRQSLATWESCKGPSQNSYE